MFDVRCSMFDVRCSRGRLLLLVLLITLLPALAPAGSRFPQPQFEGDYKLPTPVQPHPEAGAREIVDFAVFAAALVLATVLALKTRSRRGMFLLTFFSVIYFGFWRKGCICPVGSLQNVTLALSGPGYAVPLIVLGFFLLPLFFTLLFGRTFCAGVCPLGAIQDLVITRPVRVPPAAEHLLGFLAYVYLATAVLLASVGAGFIVCRFDPFVSIFRLSGDVGILLFGAGLLLLGTVVARPYCRYLCPYSVLLNWMSRFSWKHVTITPDDCIQCRLCKDSCPFGAIQEPTPEKSDESRAQGRARLLLLICLLPVFLVVGAWAGSRLTVSLSRVHPTVQLAEQIAAEEKGLLTTQTLQSEAFRADGDSMDSLYHEANVIRKRIGRRLWPWGGFLGLTLGMKLIGLSTRRTRKDYVPNRATCLSCARCFSSCPVGRTGVSGVGGRKTETMIKKTGRHNGTIEIHSI